MTFVGAQHGTQHDQPYYDVILPLNQDSAGIFLSSESDVCRRQILTTKVYPRAVRLKIFLMAVDP